MTPRKRLSYCPSHSPWPRCNRDVSYEVETGFCQSPLHRQLPRIRASQKCVTREIGGAERLV